MTGAKENLGACLVFAALLCAMPASAQDAGNPFESVTDTARDSNGRTASDRTVAVPEHSQAIPADVAVDQPPTPQGAPMVIGAIDIKAASSVSSAELAASYEPFLGMDASEATLRALADSVAQVARERGYIFASAQIPPQAVSLGVVTVELDLGGIDEVRITGSENTRLRKILKRLVRKAPRADLVERQLLLAGDLPGVRVDRTSYVREDGRGVLLVEASDTGASGYAAIDNYGPDRLGPVRARLQVDLNGIFADDDSVTVNVISTFAQPGELLFVNARYAKTLGDGATVIGIAGSAGRTHSGAELAAFNLNGRNRYAALFASRALARGNGFNLWANAELAYLNVVQSEAGTRFQDDEMITLSLNLAANYDIGIGRVYGGIGAMQGLGVAGTNRVGDPLNSRADASARFTKAYAWVDSALNLGSGFGLRLAGNGQIASRPLLSAQEIAVGGPFYGRGYDFSERFGDEGVLGLAEFRKGFDNVTGAIDWLQLYAFVDGGYISNIGTGGFGDGALASTGGGLRAQLGRLDLGIEAAAPITDDRYESGDRSPKFNLHTGIKF